MSMTQETGTNDVVYDLVSVLYHSLQGAENYERYAQDAGDDRELGDFFRSIQQEERSRAERTKQLLHRCFMERGVAS